MRLLHHHTILAGLGLAALAAAPAQAQGLNGQPVRLTFGFPGTTLSTSTGTVSAGGFTFAGDPNGLTAVVTPTQLIFTNNGAGTITFGGTGLNFLGYSLSETGGSPAAITSAVVDPATTVAGFGAGRVTFDAGDVFANFQNTTFLSGQKVTLDIDPPPVPEASTTASFGLLLALGMGGVVVAGRRNRASRGA